METQLCTSELYSACNVLFGSDIDVSPDFLRYLQMEGLKAAYRKRALETHPDRAVALDRSPLDLEEQFKEINAAYQELHDYLENPFRFRLIDDSPGKRRPRADAQAKRGASPQEGFHARSYEGTVPKRVLLYGQYVYYHGYISYRQLIDAIIWQKIQRPLLGKIALRWGWLYEEEIREILQHRRRGEKFGESAVRGGYLKSQELRIILGRQRMLQPRIGKYFVEKGILTPSIAESMAAALRSHNRRYKTK